MKRGPEWDLEDLRPLKKQKTITKRCGDWLGNACAYTYDRLVYNIGLHRSDLLERLSKNNEVERLSALLELGVKIWDFRPALEKSIKAHTHQALSALLKYAHAQQNSSTISVGTSLVTPYHVKTAIRHNNIDALKQLYEFDPNLTQNDDWNEGGLFLATRYDRPEMVKYLLRVGEDIEASWCGDPLLYFAIKERHEDISKILIENGASINKTEKYGKPILSVAIDNDMLPTIDLLLERGAKPYIDDISDYEQPCYHARKKPIIFKKLLDAGLDPNQTIKDGRPILSVAIDNDGLQTIDLLLERGAKPYIDDISDYDQPFFRASKKPIIFKKLLDAGLDPNQALDNGTLIHFICKYGTAENLSILIKEGADIEDNSYFSKTPLYALLEDGTPKDLLQKKDWLQKLEILVAAGANKEYSYWWRGGKKPVHLAIKTDSLEALSILLKPRLNQVPASLESLYENQTAIHYAVAQNKPNRDRVIEFLAKNGSDITATFRPMNSFRYMTLLEHALQQDDICCAKTVAKIFMEHNCLEHQALGQLISNKAQGIEELGLPYDVAAKTRFKFLISCYYALIISGSIKPEKISELEACNQVKDAIKAVEADIYKVKSVLFGANNFEYRLPPEVVLSTIQNAFPDYFLGEKLFADFLLSQYQKVNNTRRQNSHSSIPLTPMFEVMSEDTANADVHGLLPTMPISRTGFPTKSRPL